MMFLGQKIGQYLPKQEKLKEMMEKSFDILNHHPINEARAEKGLNKANSIWFWGAGTKPALDDFKEDWNEWSYGICRRSVKRNRSWSKHEKS